MTDERQIWILDSMATLEDTDGATEAALLFDREGRKWTLLCPSGTIGCVQTGTDLLAAIMESGHGTEQLAGWPDDWPIGGVEQEIVRGFIRDTHGERP